MKRALKKKILNNYYLPPVGVEEVSNDHNFDVEDSITKKAAEFNKSVDGSVSSESEKSLIEDSYQGINSVAKVEADGRVTIISEPISIQTEKAKAQNMQL